MRSAVVVLVGLATAAGFMAAPTSAQAAAPPECDSLVRATPNPVAAACYLMDEPADATVMNDSSGNGVDAPVDQAGLDTGYQVDGATGYRWVHRAPNEAPASPERIIQVRDNQLLDPGAGSFTVEIRFRTKENFGNIIQKGQSATRGGQWKIQNPQGRPSCLFKDSRGRRASTQVTTPLNDERFHVLTCVRTPTSVTAYVDGVFNHRKNGLTGTIDNTIPMTVGGKINCDQVETTCDYFSGVIDYVKITRG